MSVDILEKDSTHQGCMGETDSQTRAFRDAGHETSLADTEKAEARCVWGKEEKGVKQYPYLPQGQGLSMWGSTYH